MSFILHHHKSSRRPHPFTRNIKLSQGSSPIAYLREVRVKCLVPKALRLMLTKGSSLCVVLGAVVKATRSPL